MATRYFWTDANYSVSANDFIIYDGAAKLFSDYTIDNNITKKVLLEGITISFE